MKRSEALNYPCPSCGFLVFSEPTGSYDICPICGWEDDHVQLKFPLMRGGANGGSLQDYQLEILLKIPADHFEYDGYQRSIEWRPLVAEDCVVSEEPPSSGLAYFGAAGEESEIYYWEKNHVKK